MTATLLARSRSGSRRLARGGAITLLLALWMLPLLGVALTSARTMEDLNRGNFWTWPTETRLAQNYADVLFDAHLGLLLLNSFAITIPAVLGTLVLSTMAGFALACHRFKGNLVVLALFIGGNLVPFQILAIPVRSIMSALSLYDTRWGLTLFHIAFQTGFATLLMRNFIRQLPPAVIDSARADGIGEPHILIHVVVPMVRPAMAAVGVLVFTFVWNDFFWSLMLSHSSDVQPVTAGLQTLRGMWVASWNLISAASLLAAVPPALMFFLMQRHFVAGLTLGVARD